MISKTENLMPKNTTTFKKVPLNFLKWGLSVLLVYNNHAQWLEGVDTVCSAVFSFPNESDVIFLL